MDSGFLSVSSLMDGGIESLATPTKINTKLSAALTCMPRGLQHVRSCFKNFKIKSFV